MFNLHLVAGPWNSRHKDQKGVNVSVGGHYLTETTTQTYQTDNRNFRRGQFYNLVHCYKEGMHSKLTNTKRPGRPQKTSKVVITELFSW